MICVDSEFRENVNTFMHYMDFLGRSTQKWSEHLQGLTETGIQDVKVSLVLHVMAESVSQMQSQIEGGTQELKKIIADYLQQMDALDGESI